MRIVRGAMAIAWKDLLAEWRDREGLTAMFYFAFLVLFVFNFALGGDRVLIRETSSGLLWLALIFTGVLALSRSVQGELENDCLDGLLLYPAPREAVYLGKLLGNLSVMIVVQLMIFPLFGILYDVNLWSRFPQLLLIALPATIGFAAVGTLLSTMTAGLRAREALLPLLLFPLTIPLILSAVRGTEVALRGEPFNLAVPWLKLMVAFDTIVLVTSFLTFEYLLEE